MRPLHIRILRNVRNPDSLLGWVRYQLSRDNNVHFVTLPSSGTHWLRFMMAKALVDAYELDYEFTGIRPHDLVPTFRAKDQRFRYNDRESIPRIQHSHKGYSVLYRNSRVVLLVRDLRDSMVSSYDTYVGGIDPDMDFSSFLRADGVDERYHRTLERRVAFLNSWHENSEKLEDLLIVHYEDLKRDTVSEVHSVLEFVGIEAVTDGLVTDVVEFGSFKNMQRLEDPAENQPERGSADEQTDQDEGRKINEGRSDRWGEYFSNDDIEYFNRHIDENLIYEYGYDYSSFEASTQAGT